ncbi:hypothetical protein IEQ34_005542 [Dendrobium chrysotoxum]|uniref:Uncharacterized protein n=1 Tax=Dendrobium chrysotoxum TaxID=161865 RepID=A0AAV7HCJ3_DENCH|nr:hypothetical protein IEQ34_005542 [Dendrobium chrysotoxum]
METDTNFFFFNCKIMEGECVRGLSDFTWKEVEFHEVQTIENRRKYIRGKCDEMQKRRSIGSSGHAIILLYM